MAETPSRNTRSRFLKYPSVYPVVFDQWECIFKLMPFGAPTLLTLLFFQKYKLPIPSFLARLFYLSRDKPQYKAHHLRRKWIIKGGTPLFNYELSGVVVTYYEAGSLSDIYHHQQWKDFLIVKDLYVFWGVPRITLWQWMRVFWDARSEDQWDV